MLPLVPGFWVSFVVTLGLVSATVVLGLRRRRRPHLVLALTAIASLTVTIVLAERLGATRSFPPQILRVHLWFAKSATLALVPVVVTGVMLWRQPRRRWLHRVAVLLFLALVVVATVTGTWMFSLSTPN